MYLLIEGLRITSYHPAVNPDCSILTYRYRIKDATTCKHLRRMAKTVNRVWNWCGGAQEHARKWGRRWPSYNDLAKGLSGASEHIGIGSDCFQAIARQWTVNRSKVRRRPKWRISQGSRRSLGWIPFMTARAIHIDGDMIRFNKRIFRFWKSRDVPENIRCGSFNEDACGNWFLNLTCSVPNNRMGGEGEVGIDLGLKTFATLSDASTIENPRHLRKSATRLAKAQRASRKRAVRTIHRKIAAQRRHFLHTETTRIARTYRFVVVGDVNSVALARTRMAKSVLDAGWSTFRAMLSYKLAMRPGSRYVEGSERNSSRTCSHCRAVSGPQGIAGLGVRSWNCQSCGASHDRDVNAALNILASGRNIALH